MGVDDCFAAIHAIPTGRAAACDCRRLRSCRPGTDGEHRPRYVGFRCVTRAELRYLRSRDRATAGDARASTEPPSSTAVSLLFRSLAKLGPCRIARRRPSFASLQWYSARHDALSRRPTKLRFHTTSYFRRPSRAPTVLRLTLERTPHLAEQPSMRLWRTPCALFEYPRSHTLLIASAIPSFAQAAILRSRLNNPTRGQRPQALKLALCI